MGGGAPPQALPGASGSSSGHCPEQPHTGARRVGGRSSGERRGAAPTCRKGEADGRSVRADIDAGASPATPQAGAPEAGAAEAPPGSGRAERNQRSSSDESHPEAVEG
eukprot:12374616-Alexandrium_andersonii.AAC.1